MSQGQHAPSHEDGCWSQRVIEREEKTRERGGRNWRHGHGGSYKYEAWNRKEDASYGEEWRNGHGGSL